MTRIGRSKAGSLILTWRLLWAPFATCPCSPEVEGPENPLQSYLFPESYTAVSFLLESTDCRISWNIRGNLCCLLPRNKVNPDPNLSFYDSSPLYNSALPPSQLSLSLGLGACSVTKYFPNNQELFRLLDALLVIRVFLNNKTLPKLSKIIHRVSCYQAHTSCRVSHRSWSLVSY